MKIYCVLRHLEFEITLGDYHTEDQFYCACSTEELAIREAKKALDIELKRSGPRCKSSVSSEFGGLVVRCDIYRESGLWSGISYQVLERDLIEE